MKNLLAISTVVAMLLFSGCSQKDTAIDATSDVEKPQTNTTSSSEAKESSTVSGMEDTSLEDRSINQSSTSSSQTRQPVEAIDVSEKSLTVLESKLQTINFDFDKFNIRADMQGKLKTDATIIKTDASSYKVKLEGNCDEWGSDEYNYALGLRRTKATKDALVSQGVDASRISMVSFGESNPICTEQTRECWAMNRRVDFKLLP